MIRALALVCLLVTPSAADPPKDITTKLVEWVRAGCEYLRTDERIGPEYAAPHFGKVIRHESLNPNHERYLVASPTLPGWVVYVESMSTVSAAIPSAVTIRVADLEKLLGPARERSDDWRLANNTDRPRSQQQEWHPSDFEFQRLGPHKTCSIVIETDGSSANFHRHRVLNISFSD